MTFKSSTTPTTPASTSPAKWAPRSYQLRALSRLVGDPALGLLLDPGLGKTATTIAGGQTLRAKGFVRGSLVIAPLRVATLQWPAEFRKWREFKDERVVVLHGKDKAKLLRSNADWYIINPEGLGWLFEELRHGWQRGKSWPFDMLAVDESTLFKNSRTNRFKLLRQHLNQFHRRSILTGTPTPNGMLDLFGQMYILDGGRALGKYITHYRNEFFDSTGFGGFTYVLKPGATEAIYKRIAPITLRMSAEEYLELPQLVVYNRDIELPAKARDQYDAIEKNLFAELDRKGTVTAANSGAAEGKCHQVANGAVYLDDRQREYGTIHDEKLEALGSLLDELNGAPTLIAYHYGHDLDRLRKFLKARGHRDVPYIGAGQSTTATQTVVDAWNAGELPILLVHPQSAAHGLNLQGGGNHIIWFSLTYNLEHYDQLNRRLRRSGQKSTRVFCYHLVARDTVDEARLEALSRKDRAQGALLAALQGYRQRRQNGCKNKELAGGFTPAAV